LPWIKVMNDTAIAVNQLWARAGAISVTIDMWHLDILDFLEMQTETWDIRRKAFDVFPAVSIPDLFMKRVINNENWTLFDPKELRDKLGTRLEDHYWEEFEKLYLEAEAREDLELKEVVSAKELFKQMLKTVVETGMPYVFFRDTSNKYNPNKHAGMVYSSQLCTEIIQNTKEPKFVEEKTEDGLVTIKYKPGDTVVCNLASINVAKVNPFTGDMEEVHNVAMRILDNVITMNFYPVEETRLTAMKYRSVGLGYMWLAEYLATQAKLRYDSPEAVKHVDKLFEQYAYFTLRASVELAKERWKYSLFEGSDWSKGILFGKDEAWFSQNSEYASDWISLIHDIKKYWTRFAYHQAPAPNTSTSLVVGTTAWLLPVYKKYFVETNSAAPTVNVAPNLSKENFWLYKEYVHMNMQDVIDMISTIQKRIDQSISFEWIINPMEVSPRDLFMYYVKWWEKWLKTIYYVRSMSLEVEKCESCTG
jgi:ribonucleoside-diphosphate reductase alpha chain